MLSSDKLPSLEGVLVGGKSLQYSLIQKLRSRERERRQRTREPRRTLSYDAQPFYPSGDPASAGANNPTVGGSSGSSMAVADPASDQRREHGERLYPKVAALQPVSYLSCLYRFFYSTKGLMFLS